MFNPFNVQIMIQLLEKIFLRKIVVKYEPEN